MSVKLCRVVALSVVLAAGACQKPDTALYHETIVASRDQAAAILVSVNSVAPWDQVADALAPNFNLANGDAALAQVAPVTSRVQEQVLSAFGLGLGLGVAPAKLGTSATPPTTAAPALPAALPATGTGAGDAGIDPTLKYQAALALYQTVQLMNREIANAAVQSCTVPYVVQLKLAVIPYRRNLPYDVHARISFFTDSAASDQADIRPPDTPQLRGAASLTRSEANLPDTTSCKDNGDLPQAVPLLATDDIERALKSRAVETAQQIGLALSAAHLGVGGSLSANSLNEALASVSAQDINSRLTVTRQSDNTIYARIGAASAATAQYALVGQTYDVALLLLVPRAYIEAHLSPPSPATPTLPGIQVVFSTELRNTDDGSVLPDRPEATFLAQTDAAMREVLVGRYQSLDEQWSKLDAATRDRIARCIASGITTSDFDRFKQNLAAPCTPKGAPSRYAFSLRDLDPDYVIALWTRLSALLADGGFKSAAFDLPLRPDVIVPPQTAVVFDDTKDKAQIQLQNVTGAQSRTITASLLLSAGPSGKAKETYPLPAQSVAFDASTRLLTLTFPSPAKWGIGDIDWSASKLQITPQRCSTESVCPNFLLPPPIAVVYAKASGGAEAAPGFSFAAKSAQIVADKGNGTATILLDKLGAGEAVSLTVTGASFKSVVDATGKSLAVADGPIAAITQAGSVTFQFQNLHDGMTITIDAEDKKGTVSAGKKSLAFTVIGS